MSTRGKSSCKVAGSPSQLSGPRTRSSAHCYLKPEQVRSLLAAAEGSRYAPLLALLVNTGLRRGEALALHWSDVDLDEKLLRVRGALARVDGSVSCAPLV
jgi:integrase